MSTRRLFMIAMWFVSIAVAITCLTVIGMLLHARSSPLGILAPYRGELKEIEVRRRETSTTAVIDDVTLRDDRGTYVNFLLHQPVDATRQYPAVVILGGVEVGKETLSYIDEGGVIIAALAYPYDIGKVTDWWNALKEVGAMREAAFRTVAGASLVADYLQQKNIDTSSVVLVGYSFGAPFVPAVMHMDQRYKVAAILYGGGRLGALIGNNLDTGLKPLDRVLGAIAGSLLAPIEPLRHVKAIAPRPLIMIQGKYDELMLPHLAQELFDRAEQPKEIVWLETEHMMPWKKEIINQVIITLRNWLEQAGYLTPNQSD